MFKFTQREKNEVLERALHQHHYSKEKLQKALAKGGDPNHNNYYHPSSLFQAVQIRGEADSKEAVGILLEAKADISKVNDYKQNVLHYAISHSNDHIETIKRLLQEKFDLNAPDIYGKTPLFDALHGSKWEIAGLVMDHGGTLKTAASNGKTILMQALENDAPIELVRRLLTTSVDLNAAAKEAALALATAAVKGNAEYIEALLAHPNIRIDASSHDGRTALMSATAAGNRKSMETLLAAKASPDLAANDGSTPLTYAASSGSQESLELLIKHKAELDLPGAYKVTAITHAASNGNIPMVMALLAAAEQQGVKLDLGRAIFSAAERGHGRILELLIGAGADVNYTDDDGRTPLMRAALSDQVETLGILMKAGAKPDVSDRRGMSPYDHAVGAGKMKAKEFLSRYRNSTAVAQQDNKAPAAAAVSNGYSYTRLNDHSLEVREGDGLTMTFNFWTQQLIFRDIERAVPLVVQSFNDIPRQDAVTEAYEKLKELGGNPPDPRLSSSVQKKNLGLTKP